jgi:protein involved in polysaccharide export with SLBB domain
LRPGHYELTEGLTLKELIENAEGLREDAYTDRGVITRRKETLDLTTVPFNVTDVLAGRSVIRLQNHDEVTISSIENLRQERNIRVFGEVNKPGVFPYADSMALKDLIFKAGGLTEAASGSFLEVARRLDYDEAEKLTDQSSHLFQFNIGRDLVLSPEDNEFFLKPFDQVFVFRAPSFTRNEVITIRGEVKYTGNYYLRKKNEHISEIIQRAGGLTEEAYPEGAMLTRRVQMTQRERRLREDLLARDTTLEFSNLGFEVVGIDLNTILQGKDPKKDIILEDGDELIIPKELQTVKISGNVLNPISTTYIKGSKLKHYIRDAGGFDYRTRKNNIYVIYPNGTADMTQGSLIRKYPRIYPGSEIVVPQKPEREPLPATAWIAIANGMVGISVSIATLVSLTR